MENQPILQNPSDHGMTGVMGLIGDPELLFIDLEVYAFNRQSKI